MNSTNLMTCSVTKGPCTEVSSNELSVTKCPCNELSVFLVDESRNIKRHCENTKSLSNCLSQTDCGKQFWISFISDPYTRAMYPEHSLFAGMLLTMPLGSCAVERCFSYSNRIANDNRASLTGYHISALVCISQKGP